MTASLVCPQFYHVKGYYVKGAVTLTPTIYMGQVHMLSSNQTARTFIPKCQWK